MTTFRLRLTIHQLLRVAAMFATITATARVAGAEAMIVSDSSRSERATSAPARTTDGMVRLPAGVSPLLYEGDGERVGAFRLDRDPVTRGEYLEFVRRHPAWRRGAVEPLLAARATYLADWRGAQDAGRADALNRPVTGVSWHAARAYCEAQGKRLPTVAEWEYAAAASATERDATRDPRFVQRLVSVYASRRRALPDVRAGEVNAYGVRGMHDLVWEWTEDFDGGHLSHVARGVHGEHAGHGAGVAKHDMSCAGAAIGAADPSNYPGFLRQAVRAGLTGASGMETLGFRCAA